MSYVNEIANDRNGHLTAVKIVFSFLRPHERDSPAYSIGHFYYFYHRVYNDHDMGAKLDK